MGLSAFQRRRRELAAKQAAEEAAKKAAETKSIDEMTVAELKQYAADNKIDLGNAAKKAEILAVIVAHETTGDEGDQDGEGTGQGDGQGGESQDEGGGNDASD